MLKALIFSVLFLVSIVSFSQFIDPFELVNSIYDEQSPIISPDGRTLYFTRAKHPDNIGGEIDPGDIWYSTMMPDGRWSTPTNAGVLNNKGWNGVLGFVGGSDAIYLISHYNNTGVEKAKSQGISRSLKTTSGWSRPKNITIPYFRNTSKHYGGYIIIDASIAVFSLETYDSRGGEDIYVSFNRGNGQWSEPKNLGSTINSKFQEFTPFLSADTKTLFFSTNGKGNGTDIFSAKRLDDTWINWSEPKSEDLLNTDGQELGLHKYGLKNLYTSTLNSDGYGDIREFIYPEEFEDPIVAVVDTTKSVADNIWIEEKAPQIDDRLITLYGNTYNAKSGKYIETKISLKTEDDKLINTINSKMGSYALKIDAIGNYIVRVDAPGFVSHQETLELKSDAIKTLEKNIRLQPIEVGTTINLKDVLFKQSKAEFLQSSYPELNLVVDFMKENPKVEIRLEGHTDNRGVAKYNIKLSKERVDAVKNYLVKKGISRKRISGKGYGGSRPIADNNDPQTRILNRRVEFTIVKN